MEDIYEQDDNNTEDTEYPYGFSVKKKTLWYCDPSEEKPKHKRICDAFDILAQVRDVNDSAYGRIIQFATPSGGTKQIMVPNTLLHETSRTLASTLADAGLVIEAKPFARDMLQTYLNHMTAPILVYVQQSGWTKNADDEDVFVLPSGEVIGNGVIMRPERALATCLPKGTLAEWKENVAKYAVGNTRLGMAISAAFAAPMMFHTNLPSGGIHIVGPSQIAKTTAMSSATSVTGKPTGDGLLGTWRTTANAMEAVCARANDCLLPLDEMSQAQPHEVASIIYGIGNGVGKGRMNAKADLRYSYIWRTLVLSSGEEKAEDKIKAIGRKATSGIDVRLANVPADAGKGFGLFDTLHGQASGKALADLLRRNTKLFYGSAMKAFATRLVDKAGDTAFWDKVNSDCNAFIKEYLPASAASQVKSVAHRFALIAIAGEMAASWEIVPWQAGEATLSAVSCMQDWIDDRGDIAMDEPRKMIQDLQQYLSANQFSRFPTQSDILDERYRIGEITGIRQQSDGKVLFNIICSQWDKIMPKWDAKAAMKILDKQGFLKREKADYQKSNVLIGSQTTLCYRIRGSILEV